METCRICYEPGSLISVCHCSGSCAGVHFECIQEWIRVSKRKKCEICHHGYVYPGLQFPMTTSEFRIQHAFFWASVVGFVHGVAIFLDSNSKLNYIWIYILGCVLFNGMLAILLASLYTFRIRFWKVVLYFYTAFLVGNLPGHIVTERITSYVGICYACNAVFMCGFLSVEKYLFLQLRQPAHQNDIIVDYPAHN